MQIRRWAFTTPGQNWRAFVNTIATIGIMPCSDSAIILCSALMMQVTNHLRCQLPDPKPQEGFLNLLGETTRAQQQEDVLPQLPQTRMRPLRMLQTPTATPKLLRMLRMPTATPKLLQTQMPIPIPICATETLHAKFGWVSKPVESRAS